MRTARFTPALANRYGLLQNTIEPELEGPDMDTRALPARRSVGTCCRPTRRSANTQTVKRVKDAEKGEQDGSRADVGIEAVAYASAVPAEFVASPGLRGGGEPSRHWPTRPGCPLRGARGL